jgi:hypothetical protein
MTDSDGGAEVLKVGNLLKRSRNRTAMSTFGGVNWQRKYRAMLNCCWITITNRVVIHICIEYELLSFSAEDYSHLRSDFVRSRGWASERIHSY